MERSEQEGQRMRTCERPEQEERLLERLRRGAAEYACSGYLASLDSLHRCQLYTAILFTRLQRKTDLVEQLRAECNGDWYQTFYLLYFRTLGDSLNQQAYLTLARKVPYKIVLRERANPQAAEALLLGTAGLLNLYPCDTYTSGLEHIYTHLSAKYSIEPMDAREWRLANIRPANHPLLRIVQAAQFFRQDEFVMARTMGCRSEEDICRLFCVDAPEYWNSHYIPGSACDPHPKRLGRFKANIIGINLVAVLQLAYSAFTGNDQLRENALTLLDRLGAEQNRYIRAWQEAGAPAPQSALESQALLQLATEYCAKGHCAECPVGEQILQTAAGR